MAKPATTHVIEIESGIGEPAFIPLTLGQELQPISVGKKGMWRIEGARVLDVHAFVYFDGAALFLQSADESSAAMVDGYRVGKAWTELHAPCRIEVGAARLRFRSLIDEQRHPADAEQATVAVNSPPVAGVPGQLAPQAGGGGPPPRERPQTMPPATQKQPLAPPRAQPSRPAPAAGQPPMSFPKPERPFAPGALASQRDDDESTRIAPLESTGASGAVRLPGMSGAINVVAAPRPAAGRPVDEDLSTRPEAARAAKPPQQMPGGGSGPYAAMPMGSMPPQGPGAPMQPLGMPPGAPPGAMPPGMVQGVMALGSMPPGMPPGGYPAPQQPGYPPAGGYGQMSMPPGAPMPGGSGAYGAIPSGAMGAMGPMGPMGPGGMQPGQSGMLPAAGPPEPQKSEGLQPIAEVWKDPAQRRKILAFTVILLGGAFLLFFDDDDAPAPPPKRAIVDAGIDARALTSASTSAVPVIPPPPVCPPGFQPYGEVKAGQPTTCVPVQTPPEQNAAADAGPARNGAGSTQAPKDAGSATAANKPPPNTSQQKTLERQAVDYVATGEYQKAIGIYEQLSRQFPDNKVYSEALRILRQKLDAGAP